MKKIFISILGVVFIITSSFTGCEKREDDEVTQTTKKSTKKVAKPTITVFKTTTTTMDFSVIFKVVSEETPSSVMLYYGVDSPTKSSSCKLYQAGRTTNYYKATHTGFNGGNRIYYYGTATNSGGTSQTATQSCIIKR